VKRVHFFDHQFLRERDLNLEQAYHVGMRRLHNQLLHTPGIGQGLTIKGDAGGTTIQVTEGTAIDDLGREIVLANVSEDIAIDGFDPDKDVYIVISYHEEPSDPSNETGVEGDTRTLEQPTIEALPSLPDSPNRRLVLGRVLRTGTRIKETDETGRAAPAGAAAGSLEVLSLGLRRERGIDPASFVHLTLEAPWVAQLDGALHIAGAPPEAKAPALAVDGDLQVSGAVNADAVNAANALHAGSFSVTDDKGAVYPDNAIGVASNIDKSTKWLQVGGITDGGARRLALAGSLLYLAGNVGINRLPRPDRPLVIQGGEVHVGGAGAGFSFGDRGETADFDKLTAAGQRWVLYSSDATARLYTGGKDLLTVDKGGSLTLTGDGQNVTLRKGFLSIGTTAGGSAAADEVVGGVAFWGLGASHGLLAYRAKRGFELVDISPWAALDRGYKLDSLGYAPLSVGRLRVNRLYMSSLGGSSFGYNSHRSDQDTWVFPEARPAVTVEMDDAASGGTARFQVYTTTKANPANWNMRFAINGETGEVTVPGDLTVQGSKNGYVVDQFVNVHDDTLEEGDLIVIAADQSPLTYGLGDAIPIPEADIAAEAYDRRVCGIVCKVHGELAPAEPPAGRRRRKTEELVPRAFTPDDLGDQAPEEVRPRQIGKMVTLGAYSRCKVDADIAPIEAGDLLTTSPTKGHAQKVLDPNAAVGAIVGKALGSMKKGKGKIPVLVMLQ
jgi:hypothetical protein